MVVPGMGKKSFGMLLESVQEALKDKSPIEIGDSLKDSSIKCYHGILIEPQRGQIYHQPGDGFLCWTEHSSPDESLCIRGA